MPKEQSIRLVCIFLCLITIVCYLIMPWAVINGQSKALLKGESLNAEKAVMDFSTSFLEANEAIKEQFGDCIDEKDIRKMAEKASNTIKALSDSNISAVDILKISSLGITFLDYCTQFRNNDEIQAFARFFSFEDKLRSFYDVIDEYQGYKLMLVIVSILILLYPLLCIYNIIMICCKNKSNSDFYFALASVLSGIVMFVFEILLSTSVKLFIKNLESKIEAFSGMVLSAEANHFISDFTIGISALPLIVIVLPLVAFYIRKINKA